MKHYTVGDTIQWKRKRGYGRGMIVEVTKQRLLDDGSGQQEGKTEFIIQQDDGTRLLLLQSEVV